MVLDLNLQKVPLLWRSLDDGEEATWLSVPRNHTLEEACEFLEESPAYWELAEGVFLVGFVEYRRKKDGDGI